MTLRRGGAVEVSSGVKRALSYGFVPGEWNSRIPHIAASIARTNTTTDIRSI